MQRKKRRVLIDTNIFSKAYGSKNKKDRKSSQEVIQTVKNKDELIYPTHVSRELLRTPDKRKRKRFRALDKRMKRQGRYVSVTDEVPHDGYDFDPKDDDRLIVHDAYKTDTDLIISDDRKFRNRVKNKTKLKILSSSKYIAFFRRKKNYKGGKR